MSAKPNLHPRILWSRIKVRWPFFIWLLALAGFAFLWRDLGVRLTFTGLVRTSTIQIYTIESARVLKVNAQSGQLVKAGDVLVELDASGLAGEIAAAAASQASANRATQIEQGRAERQFEQSVFTAESDLADLAIRKASGAAELAALQQEIARLEPLVEKRLMDPEPMANLRARRDALAKGLEQYPAAEKTHQANIAWARQSLEQLRREATLPAKPEEAPAVAALRSRLPNFVITAPVTGVITNLSATAGASVRAGMLLASIVEPRSNTIVGFLHEDSVRTISNGQELWAFVDPSEKEFARVKVSGLGPNVIDLPSSQSLFPGRLIRGRPVFLEIQGEHQLLPGERVTIRSDMPWWVEKSRGFFRKGEGRL